MKTLYLYYSLFFLSILGGIFGVSLLTRIVNPEHYAFVAIILGFSTLVRYIILDTFSLVFSKYCFSSLRELLKYKKIYFYLALYGILIAPVIFYYFFDKNFFGSISLSAFLILYLVFVTFESIFLSLRERIISMTRTNLFDWLRFILAYFSYIHIDSSYISIIFGYILSLLIVFIIDLLIWKSKKIEKEDFSETKKFIDYKKFLYGGGLTWLILFYDRFFIQYFFSVEDLGGYFAIYQITFLPILLLFNSIWNYIISDFMKRKGFCINRLRKGIYLLIFLGLILSGFFLILEKYFALIIGSEYRGYINLASLLIFQGVLYSCANFILLIASRNNELKYTQLKTILFVGMVISSLFSLIFGELSSFVVSVIIFYIFFISYLLFSRNIYNKIGLM